MVVGLFGTAAYAEPVSPYRDGVYTGTATAKPDEDADFDAYGIKVDVTYYVKGDNGYAIYQYPVSVDVKENPGVMTAAFADETKVTVASLPADIKNPVATISSRVGRGETPVVIADAVPVVDGAILLAEAPVDGTSYTVKVVSDNYGDASATITYEAPKPQNPLADWAKTAKETGADAALVEAKK